MGAHGGARKVPAHGTSNGTSCVNLRQTSPNTPLQSDNIQGAFAPRMLPLSGDSLVLLCQDEFFVACLA